MPFVVVFTSRELVVEFIADVVDSHATINLDLELLNNDTDVTDIFLDLSELLDVLWVTQYFVLDLSELSGDIVVLLHGSVGNQFDFLLDDCLIFADISVSDILDVDFKDGNVDFLWNSLFEFLFELSVSEYIVSEPFSIDWLLTILNLVKAADIFVWVEFLFGLELAEGLIILVEWLNSFGKSLSDGVIGIPQPSKLVWKH